MSWSHACGDETCSVCKRKLTEGEETHYDREHDKLRCMPCVDRDDDAMSGKLDAQDPRYNDEVRGEE
jgi:hypothetical protein